MNNELPMGLTKWKKHGIKFGYWDYFSKEVFLKGERRRIIHMIREEILDEMESSMDEEMRKFREGFAYKPKKKK